MIDIQTALYNIMHSRHGRDVRQSLHDSIYQMNENANEALQKAKSMGVGTAVDSASSSTEGYVEGNLYLNTDTWDLWQCVGVNSWLNTGNVKGEKGDKGTDGINNFVHIRYSAYYDGTDFTATPTASSQFIGLYYGTSATAPTNKQDYQWTSYVGSAGTNAYVYVRYSESPDGTNFVDAPTALTKYIGFYAGSSSSAPANKASYVWSMYVGRDGEGSGDMREDIYAPNATEQGLVGTVDRALEAKTAETATDATNAENLKKSNGEILDVDTVSTKLQKVDDIRGNIVTGTARSYSTVKDWLEHEYQNLIKERETVLFTVTLGGGGIATGQFGYKDDNNQIIGSYNKDGFLYTFIINNGVYTETQNQICVNYNNKIRIITSNTRAGSFTAPRTGVAYCDLHVNNSYINVSLNNVLVACYSTNSAGDLISPIMMRKGDVISWNTGNDTSYMRGDSADRSVFV